MVCQQKVKKPTGRQVCLLTRQKLAVPPTKNEASNLIHFLLDGNETVFQVKTNKRIRYAREQQSYWLGAQVKCKGTTGTVIRLRWRSHAELDAIRVRYAHHTCRQPFRLVVELDTGQVLEEEAKHVAVINPGCQKQLF